MNTEKRLEVEVKVQVQAVDPWRQKIRLLPAVLETGRSHERNIVFDTGPGDLRRQGILLRLRQQGEQAILTMKLSVQNKSIYKVREETEVQVSEFAGMEKILLAAGFQAVFIYEKFREVFMAFETRIMVDETPIGNFLEIEGDPKRIDAVTASLGFSPADYITDSYYRLFLASGGSGHMVFAK